MRDIEKEGAWNGLKMKGETLQKPPPLLLPPAKRRPESCGPHTEDEKFLADRAVQKFTARYDAFQGILKRVSEMKMSGSLDSEEPSTGSEKSESSASGPTKRRVQCRRSFVDDRSNASAFEDESSASSVAGSDRCSPYEEIRSLPRCPPHRANVSSFRTSFPPPPSPTLLRETVPSGTSAEGRETKRQSFVESRSRSGSGDRGADFVRPSDFPPDVEDERGKVCEGRLSLEQSEQPEGISEAEKHQVEMFFRSLKTDVYVCGSLANLYVGWKEGEGNWAYRHTGVVVVVFDSGDTRCRSKRKIQILLAERGTCFPLWKDTIDNLSAYHKSGSAFHTMHLSRDHRQMVGLSFDSASEADRLLRHLEQLTSNPENINISVPGSGKKKPRPKKHPPPLPQKKHISNPCLFQHVTSVAAKDKPIYMSMQTLIDNENIKKVENIC